KICDRDAGDRLVAGAAGRCSPRAASLVKTAASVQACDQGCTLRGRQNLCRRPGLPGRKQQGCGRVRLTSESKLPGMVLQHSHVSPPQWNKPKSSAGEEPCGLKIGKRESQKCTLNRKERCSQPVHSARCTVGPRRDGAASLGV